jgi:hypothetical protein
MHRLLQPTDRQCKLSQLRMGSQSVARNYGTQPSQRRSPVKLWWFLVAAFAVLVCITVLIAIHALSTGPAQPTETTQTEAPAITGSLSEWENAVCVGHNGIVFSPSPLGTAGHEACPAGITELHIWHFVDLSAAKAAVRNNNWPFIQGAEYTGTVMGNGTAYVFISMYPSALAALPIPEHLLAPLSQFGFQIDTIHG